MFALASGCELNNPYCVQYKTKPNESGGDKHLKCMLLFFSVYTKV